MYGTLWDATLEWFVDLGATNSNGIPVTYNLVGSDSTTWGNYKNSTFEYITLYATTPFETNIKEINNGEVIPTGSAEYAKVNNIYDIAGNAMEWLLDSAVRGGCAIVFNTANSRYGHTPLISYHYNYYGCRAMLWIK